MVLLPLKYLFQLLQQRDYFIYENDDKDQEMPISYSRPKRKLSYTAGLSSLKEMTQEDWENTFKLKILEFIRKVYIIPKEQEEEECEISPERKMEQSKDMLKSGFNKKQKSNEESSLQSQGINRVAQKYIEFMEEFSKYIQYETKRIKSLKQPSQFDRQFYEYFFDSFLGLINDYAEYFRLPKTYKPNDNGIRKDIKALCELSNALKNKLSLFNKKLSIEQTDNLAQLITRFHVDTPNEQKLDKV